METKTTKTINIIPARSLMELRGRDPILQKKRVAAYARVSTDSDEQEKSFEAQKSYFENYIKTAVIGSLSLFLRTMLPLERIQKSVLISCE